MLTFWACSQNEYSLPDNLTADDVDLEIVATDVLNEYTLINNTAETSAIWDMGNGVSESGNEVTAQYTFAGTYTITVTIISQGGTVDIQEELVIAEDNPAFLSGYPYDELTGGSSRTWAVDGYASAAFGLGPTLADPTEWWADASGQRAGNGLYDDRFTFSITEDGLAFMQETNGDVYANSSWASDLGDTEGNLETTGGTDYVMPYDGGLSVCQIANDVLTTDGGFLGYYAGATEFNLISVSDELLEIAFWDSKNSFYWYTMLVPEDLLTEEPEEVVKLVESNDIYEDFEGNGNIDWSLDITGFETISNFAKVGVNTSDNIAMYSKGTGVWENIYTELDYYMDLSTRNVFTMKVFVPNFNDYETECDSEGTSWLTDHNLKPQVDVKLQDSSLGGNAWETQVVVSNTISEEDYGTWVDLTFDFSGSSDRTDFDKIVVQLGAEGHCNEGIFYIDDFILSE